MDKNSKKSSTEKRISRGSVFSRTEKNYINVFKADRQKTKRDFFDMFIKVTIQSYFFQIDLLSLFLLSP
jgi:hypothetical protein